MSNPISTQLEQFNTELSFLIEKKRSAGYLLQMLESLQLLSGVMGFKLDDEIGAEKRKIAVFIEATSGLEEKKKALETIKLYYKKPLDPNKKELLLKAVAVYADNPAIPTNTDLNINRIWFIIDGNIDDANIKTGQKIQALKTFPFCYGLVNTIKNTEYNAKILQLLENRRGKLGQIDQERFDKFREKITAFLEKNKDLDNYISHQKQVALWRLLYDLSQPDLEFNGKDYMTLHQMLKQCSPEGRAEMRAAFKRLSELETSFDFSDVNKKMAIFTAVAVGLVALAVGLIVAANLVANPPLAIILMMSLSLPPAIISLFALPILVAAYRIISKERTAYLENDIATIQQTAGQYAAQMSEEDNSDSGIQDIHNEQHDFLKVTDEIKRKNFFKNDGDYTFFNHSRETIDADRALAKELSDSILEFRSAPPMTASSASSST